MELNFVISIFDRYRSEEMISLLNNHDIPLAITMLGNGTATSEHLDIYGLQAIEKAVICTLAGSDKTKQIMKSAKRRLFIDIPGNGILMAVPVKSVGGGKTLAYLTNNSVADNSIPSLSFEYELIMIIMNEGHTDPVMDAARSAGAGGGTVLHAKGTGQKRAEKFFGVSLADEKEVLLIVAKSNEKAAIMTSVSRETGPDTPSGAICFSLPISAVAGLRMTDDD